VPGETLTRPDKHSNPHAKHPPPAPSSSTPRSFKLNLLTSLPLVRAFLRGDFFPERLNHGFTKYAFAVVVAALFIGPQDREHNVFLNFFWCGNFCWG
jgi:hypothetical protein